jgi:hypothetical protein
MCQNLFAFLKKAQPFSIASIASSKVLVIHLLHWVRARTLFVCVDFFACVVFVRGMFYLFIIVGSKLLPMRGILNMMTTFCFLALVSNNLVVFN